VRKLNLLAITVVLVAGCGSGPPHSDYFIVTFVPGTPALSDAGTTALDNAVNEAKRDHPGMVNINVVVPAQVTDAASLAQQRIEFLTQAFLKGGIAITVLHADIGTVDDQNFALRKDSAIVKLGFGISAP
jgi:hypothetical protein